MLPSTPIHPTVVQHWYSTIHANDWLSACLNALSIFAALMIASLITPWLDKRKAVREQRERLLRLMLHTWPTPANQDWQSSIALIKFDFKGCEPVLKARQAYLQAANLPPAPDAGAAKVQSEYLRKKQAELIAAVANELGHDTTAEGFLAETYVSKGFTDREELILNALGAWERIAKALELNNELFRLTVAAQLGHAPPPSESGSQGSGPS
jgi:hypothetical protein